MTPLPIRNVVNAQTCFFLKNPIEPPQIFEQKIFLPFYVLNILQLVLPYPFPTYPSPLPKFCFKSEVSVNIGLGEG